MTLCCRWNTGLFAALFAAGCSFVLPNSAPAQDWPMHRGGPQLQGVSHSQAPSQPKLGWSFNAGKPVKGSAAIASDRVYFGDDGGTLHALDLRDGHEIWAFKTEGPIEATPLVLNNSVFFGSSDAQFYSLNSADGSLRWKYSTGDKILGGANYAPGPEGKGFRILIGGYDSSLHCLHSETGEVLWTHPTDNYINGTPALFPSGEIVFGGCDAVIHVLSLHDGAELRQIESDAYIASSVAVADGVGYVGNYGNLVLAFNPAEGRILWKYRDRNFAYFSSAAIAGPHLVIGGRDKQLHCIDRATGLSVWKFKARGVIDSSPVVCGDAVIVGAEDGRLYCVSLADGSERWAYEIGAPITASPAVANGSIVIGAEDGTVYCFTEAKP
jgi:outer membrane protein assembly factor BamB